MTVIPKKRLLIAIRKHFGDTQEQAAVRLGFSLHTIQQWETQKGGISDRNYPKVLKTYGITAQEAQNIAEENHEAWKQAKKDADISIGISERGYPITVSKIVKLLAEGKPIDYYHREAVRDYADYLFSKNPIKENAA